MSDATRDEFFVGYLPTPRGHRRWLRAAAVATLAATASIGVGIAAFQRDPGDAAWDTTDVRQLEGVVSLTPCPTLRVARPDGGAPKRVLLVGEGKLGLASRLAGMDGATVRVAGYPLTRAAVHMFEVRDAPDAIRPLAAPAAESRKVLPTGTRTRAVLRGEIVDAKCFAGAMKPGDGKPHKGCAVLCLRGGVPAVLATADAQYLLVDDTGAALSGAALDAVLPFVGDRVEVAGEIDVSGDLKVFRVALGAVRRL